MWFDAQAALAKIGGGDAPPSAPVMPDKREAKLAEIAGIAEYEAHASEIATSAARQLMASPYGESPGGRPLTYTGRVVSLEAWRAMAAWERHGPRGQIWSGASQGWEKRRERT